MIALVRFEKDVERGEWIDDDLGALVHRASQRSYCLDDLKGARVDDPAHIKWVSIVWEKALPKPLFLFDQCA